MDDAHRVSRSGQDCGGRLGLESLARPQGQDVLRLGRHDGLAVELPLKPRGQYRLLGDSLAVVRLPSALARPGRFGLAVLLRSLRLRPEVGGDVVVRTSLRLVLEARQILFREHECVQQVGVLDLERVLLRDALVNGILRVHQHSELLNLVTPLVRLCPRPDLSDYQLLILAQLRPLVVEILGQVCDERVCIGVLRIVRVGEFQIAGILIEIVIFEGGGGLLLVVGVGLDAWLGLDARLGLDGGHGGGGGG